MTPAELLDVLRSVLGLGKKDDIALVVSCTGTADVCYASASGPEKLLTIGQLSRRRHAFLADFAKTANASVVEVGCGFPTFDPT